MKKINYSQQGDYLLPDLAVPVEEEVHLGKYAYLRKEYLMKKRYGMYLNLLTSGKLNQHLLQTEEEAYQRMEILVYDIAENAVVTIGMKDYEIEFLSEERAVLRDRQYPIFTEELSREELDRKMRENPANDHLKIKQGCCHIWTGTNDGTF